MKQEDLQVGQRVYSAAFEVPMDDKPSCPVYVRVLEFEVKMLGKARFELVGKGGRRYGEYSTNPKLIASLASSPAEAVDFLYKVTEQRLAHALARIEHTKRQANEELMAIMEWRNLHGL
jgi:hypothetical protein